MTVCVASIAAKRKAIVMVADKAITFGKERPLQADLGIEKMLPIGKTGWQALVAGDASFAQEVVDAAVEQIAGESTSKEVKIPDSTKTMMRCMKDACKKVRRQWAMDRFIAPRLFNETDPFAGLPDEYVIELSGAIAQYEINCSLLVCGFDSDRKPHIFSVLSPGLAISHDIPGFHAVGIGRDIALGQLYQYETKETERLDQVMYELFDAKATAELVQGVGYLWDCSVLIPDLPEPVKMTIRVRDALEGILREATCSPYSPGFGSSFHRIDEWKETVRKFADDLLGLPHRNPPPKRRRKLTPRK